MDYQIFSKILNVKKTSFLGAPVYILTVYIYNDASTQVELKVAAAEKNIEDGYIPRVGDSVTCNTWLMGYFV